MMVNALTTDDREGWILPLCGVKPSSMPVGRAKLENYRYDNIMGSELNELYINPAYPAMPAYYVSIALVWQAVFINVDQQWQVDLSLPPGAGFGQLI